MIQTLPNPSVIISLQLPLSLPAPCDPQHQGILQTTWGPQLQNSAYFAPTSPDEIESLCKGLDPSKGPGHDDLAPNIFRYLSHELSFPLSNLINACLVEGYFPDFCTRRFHLGYYRSTETRGVICGWGCLCVCVSVMRESVRTMKFYFFLSVFHVVAIELRVLKFCTCIPSLNTNMHGWFYYDPNIITTLCLCIKNT